MKSKIILFLLLISMMVSCASAETLASDNFNRESLGTTNWTVYYTSGAVIDDNQLLLGSAVGKGAGWKPETFSGTRIISFDYVGNATHPSNFGVYINGSGVNTPSGAYVQIRTSGAHRFYHANGSYVSLTNTGSTLSASVRIEATATGATIYVDDSSIGTVLSPMGTGSIEFRQQAANGILYIDNFVLTDEEPETPPEDNDIFYVSSSGSDSNNGHSISEPLATIQHVLDTENESIIVYVIDDGVYYNQTINIKANNTTVCAYNGTPLLTSSTATTGENWSTKIYDSYLANFGHYDNVTLDGLNVTYYSGGIYAVGSYTTISNCTFLEFAGRNAADTKTRATINVDADLYADARGVPLHDVLIFNNTFGNDSISGSLSPNTVNILGDREGRNPYNITIENNEKFGQNLHQVWNIQVRSSEYTASSSTGIGIENITFRNNYMHGIPLSAGTYAYPYGIASLQGILRGLTVDGDIYSNNHYGFVGIITNSTLKNVHTQNLSGTSREYHAVWLQKVSTDYSPQGRSSNSVLENWTTWGSDYDDGLIFTAADDITVRSCDFWAYTLQDGDITIEDHNASRPTYYIITNNARTSDTDITNSFTNGRLFIEDAAANVTANASGTFLDIGNDEYVTITMLNYTAVPNATVTYTNISADGFTATDGSDTVLNITRLSDGNYTSVGLAGGTVYISFASLDFTGAETILISAYSPADTTPSAVNGSNVSFSANLSSSGFYEWLVNDSVVSNGTSTSALYNYTASSIGDKNITIRTDDDQQTWILSIAPNDFVTISPTDTTPENIPNASRTFAVTLTNPDTVRWYRNNVLVQTNTSTTSASYTTSSATNGTFNITAISLEDSQTWTWTVTPEAEPDNPSGDVWDNIADTLYNDIDSALTMAAIILIIVIGLAILAVMIGLLNNNIDINAAIIAVVAVIVCALFLVIGIVLLSQMYTQLGGG